MQGRHVKPEFLYLNYVCFWVFNKNIPAFSKIILIFKLRNFPTGFISIEENGFDTKIKQNHRGSTSDILHGLEAHLNEFVTD